MAHNRLLEIFETFDPEHIERIFGREFVLNPPDPSIERAPIERVAIITEAFLPKVDGVSKTAFLTLSYLRQTGRQVLVLAPDIAPDRMGDTRVVPLRSVGFPGVPETRMALPNIRIAQELERFQPDLIHLFSPAIMSVSGMAMGRHYNVPIIANYQTDLPGYSHVYGYSFAENIIRNWLRYIHNGCHLTLAPTNHVIEDLRSHGFKRVRHWGRGVNVERFNPEKRTDAWRKKLLNGRDPDSLVCVYVGRLATEKRVELLYEVAQLPGVALTIIGDGAEREELEAYFAGTDTHFTGYLLGDDLPQAFASSDVFLFTGPNETFGQVVQEAMASALPSIVINQGGVRDVIEEGITGFTCPPSASAFAERVRQLQNDPALLKQMSDQARQTAETRPWEAIMAQLEDYYLEAFLLNKRFKKMFGFTTYHQPTNFHKAIGF